MARGKKVDEKGGKKETSGFGKGRGGGAEKKTCHLCISAL